MDLLYPKQARYQTALHPAATVNRREVRIIAFCATVASEMKRKRRMPDSDEPIADATNLGPRSAAILAAVGVETMADLRAVGVVEAFVRAKLASGEVTLNLLWALEGAVEGISWRDVSVQRKAELRRAVAETLRAD